jgi:peptidylprolyl isomerase
VSATTPPPPPPATIADSGAPDLLAGVNATAPAPEACPLCGTPLRPEQEWCLHCGAAARTRLATSSNWRAPIIAVAAVVALSLGVLAASLVALAGESGSRTPATTTVTTAPAAGTPTTATTTSAAATPTTSAPNATTPGAATPTTSAPNATTPGATTPAVTTPNTNTGTASGPLSKEPKVTPPSGAAPTTVKIQELITGAGAVAKPGGTVTVNYVGVLFNGGAEFDSSWRRGKPFTFTLGTNQVISGWDEGVTGMRVGGRRELIVPASLAYGASGLATRPVAIPPNAPLVFVVDMLKA